MTKLFGIKNCDTVKKARAWLDAKKIPYEFHDLRIDGLSDTTVNSWLAQLGCSTLVNNRSTTWKQLTPSQQQDALSAKSAQVLLANPTLIKRPVLDHAGTLQVGFSDDLYQRLFFS